MKFSIKDFFSKCDQIRRNLRIWSHLLKKFLIENFNFFVDCASYVFRIKIKPVDITHNRRKTISRTRTHVQ